MQQNTNKHFGMAVKVGGLFGVIWVNLEKGLEE